MVLFAGMWMWCYANRLKKAIRKAKRATDAATLREQKAVADLMKRCYRQKKIYPHPLSGENGTQGSAQLRSARRKKEEHEYGPLVCTNN
jgi:hypothetical protein